MNRAPSCLERLGNALAFGLVLVIIVAGGVAVYRTVQPDQSLLSFGGSEQVRPTAIVLAAQQPTLTPFEGMRTEPTPSPTTSPDASTPVPPTETPTVEATASPTSTETPTATPTETATPSPSPTATFTAIPSATATPEPSATPFPTETPLPTTVPPTAIPAFLFRVAAAGPDYGRGCEGYYLFGYVRDAAGNPLPGLRIRATNQYGFEAAPATTKQEPRGGYDIPISAERAFWYVQVVDAANDPLSPPVEVLNTGNFVAGSEGCWHQVDFVRVN